MSEHLLNSHCRFATGDLDQSREILSAFWERHEIRLSSGWKYGIRWHQVDLTHTSLSYMESPTSVHIVIGPTAHTYRFGFLLDGTARYLINGHASSLTPELALLTAPGQMLDGETQPHRVLQLSFDGAFVENALARRFGAVPPFDEWVREVPLRAGPIASLRSLILWMAAELDIPGCWLLQSPRAALGLERAMLGLYLDCLGDLHPAKQRPSGDPATRRIKRVEEWIDANYREAVMIDDLAEVAGISVRSLQAAFRRLRNCTPMEALIRRRLDAACAALRDARPETTVTQVATDCGFFHLGRFASKYREVFGETPTATLARARQR